MMSVAIETESEFTRAGLIASATLCPDTGQAGPWNFVTPFHGWLGPVQCVPMLALARLFDLLN